MTTVPHGRWCFRRAHVNRSIGIVATIQFMVVDSSRWRWQWSCLVHAVFPSTRQPTERHIDAFPCRTVSRCCTLAFGLNHALGTHGTSTQRSSFGYMTRTTACLKCIRHTKFGTSFIRQFDGHRGVCFGNSIVRGHRYMLGHSLHRPRPMRIWILVSYCRQWTCDAFIMCERQIPTSKYGWLLCSH